METLEEWLCAWFECESCMKVRENVISQCCASKRWSVKKLSVKEMYVAELPGKELCGVA